MVRTPDSVSQASVGRGLLSAIAAGAALGFLPWNFYPAKIFMGDSGSLLLGLLLAVATISGVGQNLEGPSGGDLAAIAIPIAVPLLVLAVPAPRRRPRDRAPDAQGIGDRARRQGAHPPPPDGHRAHATGRRSC